MSGQTNHCRRSRRAHLLAALGRVGGVEFAMARSDERLVDDLATPFARAGFCGRTSKGVASVALYRVKRNREEPTQSFSIAEIERDEHAFARRVLRLARHAVDEAVVTASSAQERGNSATYPAKCDASERQIAM